MSKSTKLGLVPIVATALVAGCKKSTETYSPPPIQPLQEIVSQNTVPVCEYKVRGGDSALKILYQETSPSHDNLFNRFRQVPGAIEGPSFVMEGDGQYRFNWFNVLDKLNPNSPYRNKRANSRDFPGYAYNLFAGERLKMPDLNRDEKIGGRKCKKVGKAIFTGKRQGSKVTEKKIVFRPQHRR